MATREEKERERRRKELKRGEKLEALTTSSYTIIIIIIILVPTPGITTSVSSGLPVQLKAKPTQGTVYGATQAKKHQQFMQAVAGSPSQFQRQA